MNRISTDVWIESLDALLQHSLSMRRYLMFVLFLKEGIARIRLRGLAVKEQRNFGTGCVLTGAGEPVMEHIDVPDLKGERIPVSTSNISGTNTGCWIHLRSYEAAHAT